MLTTYGIKDSGSSNCALPWQGGPSLDGACYLFEPLTDYTRTWHQSKDICASIRPDSHLAELRTQSQLDFVNSHRPGIPFWVGGNDLTSTGQWEWEGTHEALPPHSSYFWSGSEGSTSGSHCMLFWYGDTRMHDHPCSASGDARPLCMYWMEDGWYLKLTKIDHASV